MKPHTRRCQRRVRYGHGHVAQITFFGEGLTCFFLFFFGDTIIPNFPRPPLPRLLRCRGHACILVSVCEVLFTLPRACV